MTENVASAIGVLRDLLQRERQRGESRVFLTQAAKRDLRQLLLSARQPPPPISPASQAQVPPPPVVMPLPEDALPSAPADREQAPVAQPRRVIQPTGMTKADKIASLKQRIAEDAEARLPSLRETMVFSVGNPESAIMFIGEAPGSEEEKLGEPFVGPAGQLLSKIIAAMGFRREEIYISNICKYRPAMANQGVGNRPPTPEEMQACLPYIMAEIDAIEPRVIVGLGGTSLAGLTGETTPVSRVRGRLRQWKGYPFVITYHPSYLLRNDAMSEKRKVWEDMLLVLEELALPITQKQRNYFLPK